MLIWKETLLSQRGPRADMTLLLALSGEDPELILQDFILSQGILFPTLRGPRANVSGPSALWVGPLSILWCSLPSSVHLWNNTWVKGTRKCFFGAIEYNITHPPLPQEALGREENLSISFLRVRTAEGLGQWFRFSKDVAEDGFVMKSCWFFRVMSPVAVQCSQCHFCGFILSSAFCEFCILFHWTRFLVVLWCGKSEFKNPTMSTPP